MTSAANTGALARLLEQATPGPWKVGGEVSHGVYLLVTEDERPETVQAVAETGFDRPRDNAHLIALAPDAVRLAIEQHPLIEWVASIRCLEPDEYGDPACEGTCFACIAPTLLARFAALEERAAQ